MMGQEEHGVSASGLFSLVPGGHGRGRDPSSTGTSSFPLSWRELKVRAVKAATKGPSRVLAGAALTLLSCLWPDLACSYSGHTHTVPYQSRLDDPRGGHPVAWHMQLGPGAGEHQALPSRGTRPGSGFTHGEPLGFPAPHPHPTGPGWLLQQGSPEVRLVAGLHSAEGLLHTHLASWHPALTKLPGEPSWPLRIKPWQLSVHWRITGSPAVSTLWMERPRCRHRLSEAQM